MIKKIIPALLLVLFVVALPFQANAGFGISPPYLKTNKLIPGSKYEQTITLLRSSAEDVLETEVFIEAPQIKSWITIDKGTKFDLPKDQLQVPMVITVTPPSNADLGNYKGYINVRVSPKGAGAAGGVAIALGARIDIDITLTNEAAPDFKVRTVDIPSIEMLDHPWDWPILRWFFYRLKVVMNLENTGNVKTAPSKVVLEVYDLMEKNLLESSVDKSVEKIEPFSVKEVKASFPTKLGPGDYWGRVKIYKENEVLNSYKIAFRVAPPGTYPAGRIKLGAWPYIIYSGAILFLLLILYILYRIRIWQKLWKLILLLFKYTVSPVLNIINKTGQTINKKFWKWLKDKASKYDE